MTATTTTMTATISPAEGIITVDDAACAEHTRLTYTARDQHHHNADRRRAGALYPAFDALAGSGWATVGTARPVGPAAWRVGVYRPGEQQPPAPGTRTSTGRDYTGEYLAARTDARRPGATLTERGEAQRRATRIANAARKAGVDLDEIAVDEQARAALYS